MKKTLKSINPVSGEVIAEYNEMSHEAINTIITEAHSEFYRWRQLSYDERAQKMQMASDILLQRKKDYATLSCPGLLHCSV